jgi:hypothetical protein
MRTEGLSPKSNFDKTEGAKENFSRHQKDAQSIQALANNVGFVCIIKT